MPVRLLTTLIASLMSRDVRVVIRRLKLKLTLYGLAGLLSFAAFGFLLAALTIWMSESMTPFEACVVMALGLGALSGAIVAVVAVMNRRDRRRRRRAEVTGDVGRAALIAASATVLPLLLRNKSLVAGVAAAGAAFYMLTNGRGGDDQA